MRIIMISPTPFCPSLDPCDRLTPAEVKTRTARIQDGGLWSFGGSYNRGSRIQDRHKHSIPAARRNPNRGERSRDSATALTLPKFISRKMDSSCNRALAIPTPIIAPISVWELEAGIPLYQVPTFQVMAAIRIAKIIAVPPLDPTLTKRSTGSRCTIANATPTPPRYTPTKLQMPDSSTALLGLRE